MGNIILWVIPVITLILGIFIGRVGFPCATCKKQQVDEELQQLIKEAKELDKGFKS